MKTMKLFAAMFVAATMFAVTGCSKDDEKTVSKDDVIGSWGLETLVYTRTISGLTGEYAQYNGSQTDSAGPEEGESSIFTFNSDGTCTLHNIFIEDEETISETSTGTWSVSDNMLTFDLVDEAGTADHQVMTIKEISSTKFVLTKEASMEQEFVPGQMGTLTISVEMILKKV